MNKYFVLFAIPKAAIQEWMTNVDEATRKEQTEKMMTAWQQWVTEHESVILDKGMPLGKTKRADANGVMDSTNDYNWYLVITAESHDAAAVLIQQHPHLRQIPSAYAEIMDCNRPGM